MHADPKLHLGNTLVENKMKGCLRYEKKEKKNNLAHSKNRHWDDRATAGSCLETTKRIKDLASVHKTNGCRWLDQQTKWPCDCMLPPGERLRVYVQINYSVNVFDLCMHTTFSLQTCEYCAHLLDDRTCPYATNYFP